MSNLYDRMLRDLSNTAFRLDQVGTRHTINGREVTIVVDNEKMAEKNDVRSRNEAPGLNYGSLMYYIRRDDLESIPKEGDWQEFDNRPGIVMSVSEDPTMLEVVLRFNKG